MKAPPQKVKLQLSTLLFLTLREKAR
jgi:hypothetical protein